MPKLDIKQALTFLDLLDPGGRHTIASEAPFGGVDGGPKWEDGATFEAHQREWLIKDIQERQARGSNVYYSVNRACPVWEQQGYRGKCNARRYKCRQSARLRHRLFTDAEFDQHEISCGPEAIIRHRFWRWIPSNLFVQMNLLISNFIAVINSKNEILTNSRPKLPNWPTISRHCCAPSSCHIKIDNMSNIDRVMRLPGTVNFPKAEKLAKGQTEAQAHIPINNNQMRFPCSARSPSQGPVAPPSQPRRPYVQRANDPWTPYAKAKFCCEYIRDCGIADTNEWYSLNVMFPLIGEAINGTIHDGRG